MHPDERCEHTRHATAEAQGRRHRRIVAASFPAMVAHDLRNQRTQTQNVSGDLVAKHGLSKRLCR